MNGDRCLTRTLCWSLTAMQHGVFFEDEWAAELRSASLDLARDATAALARGETGRDYERLIRDISWARSQAADLDPWGMVLS